MRFEPTCAVLENKPDQILCDYHLVESRDVWVDELSVMVDFARKIGVDFVRRLENNLRRDRSDLVRYMENGIDV